MLRLAHVPINEVYIRFALLAAMLVRRRNMSRRANKRHSSLLTADSQPARALARGGFVLIGRCQCGNPSSNSLRKAATERRCRAKLQISLSKFRVLTFQ